MRALVAALAVLAVSSPAAVAADPESGSLSKSSPSVSWTGVSDIGFLTTYSWIVTDVVGEDAPVLCQAPSCDTFSLNVAEAGADLVVAVTAGQEITGVVIEHPDGSRTYDEGIEPEPTTTVRLRRAKAGDYTVRVAVTGIDAEPYKAVAGLEFPAVPKPAVTAPAATAPAPAAAPAPVAAAPGVAVAATKVSARKAKRRLSVALSSTGPVANVRVVLRKGSKVVATGTLLELDGKGRLTLKLKKALKAGSYSIAVSVPGGAGATAPLKVTR
jgi:hypothetical protein